MIHIYIYIHIYMLYIYILYTRKHDGSQPEVDASMQRCPRRWSPGPVVNIESCRKKPLENGGLMGFNGILMGFPWESCHMLPSGEHTNSYWKWPIEIGDFPIRNGDFSHWKWFTRGYFFSPCPAGISGMADWSPSAGASCHKPSRRQAALHEPSLPRCWRAREPRRCEREAIGAAIGWEGADFWWWEHICL